MATPIPGKSGIYPRATGLAATTKSTIISSGGFSSEQLSPDSNNFPALYEAAILYAADCYDAAEATLKDHLKTKDGKDSIRTWLMLFDLYQLTHNRPEFDNLSMLFSVKFERSPPVWADSADTSDPRRKEKRERKDFFSLRAAADGALLGEIDKFEAFATRMGGGRIGLDKVDAMLSEEAELFSIVFQRLRRSKIPIWFNGLDQFASMLKNSINEAAGEALANSLGYWSLLFELYILDGKLNEYEELGLEYAVAFEVSPPPWDVVVRPAAPDGPSVLLESTSTSTELYSGFPLKGVISASNKEMLQQLAVYAASHQEVLIDMSNLMRIDFAVAGQFFEAIRAIHLAQKRVILANLNELTAALLEVFGMTKHAILMRKKAA